MNFAREMGASLWRLFEGVARLTRVPVHVVVFFYAWLLLAVILMGLMVT